jgi:hypothetical protein
MLMAWDFERFRELQAYIIHTTIMALVKQVGGLLPDYYTPETISCCASNLTVNFSTILVGRAGEPVSVFN